jgi:hypothetical protein
MKNTTIAKGWEDKKKDVVKGRDCNRLKLYSYLLPIFPECVFGKISVHTY